MSSLRIQVSFGVFLSCILLVYFSMWLALNTSGFLSPANTKFVLWVGAGYGAILTLIVNCFPMRDRRKTFLRTGIAIGAIHLVLGALFFVWVVGIATI